MLTKSNERPKRSEASDKKICRCEAGEDPSRIMVNNKNQHYREKM